MSNINAQQHIALAVPFFVRPIRIKLSINQDIYRTFRGTFTALNQ